jgi:hypothetical protein
VLPLRRIVRRGSPRAALAASAAIVLGVIAGMVGANWIFPANASASTNYCSSTYHYWNNMTTPNQHRGTRAVNLHVFTDPAFECAHSSTLISMGPAGDWVEVGYIDAISGIHPSPSCQFVGDDKPQVYRFFSKAGTSYCDGYGDVVGVDNDHSFSVVDQNADMHWAFSMDGSYLGGTVGMPFSLSYTMTNGERYGPDETEQSSFKDLQYMPANGSGWLSWGDAVCNPPGGHHNPSDPFDSVKVSITWVTVAQTGPPAC